MATRQPFPHAPLDECGLNRQAVFNLHELPTDLIASLGYRGGAGLALRQLILIGHGGKALWEAVAHSGIASADPIDEFTVRTVRAWMAGYLPGHCYEILYPGSQPVALQGLGALAGWHHASPLMLGIDAEWGTWYAYRAVVLADTDFAPFPVVDRAPGDDSPCASCRDRPCIDACPAAAMAGGSFKLEKCVAFRQQEDSPCAFTCLARVACPVASEHRYSAEQLHHSYSISLQTIRKHD